MTVNWGNVIAVVCLALFLLICAYLYMTILNEKTRSKSSRTTFAGSFVINHTDPMKDLVTIELDVDLVDIEKSDVIMFKVVTDAKSPQN